MTIADEDNNLYFDTRSMRVHFPREYRKDLVAVGAGVVAALRTAVPAGDLANRRRSLPLWMDPTCAVTILRSRQTS